MRKILAAGLAALTFGGAVAAAAIPTAAAAREWRGDRGYGGYDGYGYRGEGDHHRRDNGGAAIVAGIAGLAIGAALASGGHHRDYDRGDYGRGYYDRGDYGRGGYGYGYGYSPGYYDEGDYGYGYRSYAVCESRRWVWDPYIGRRVLVTSHYAC